MSERAAWDDHLAEWCFVGYLLPRLLHTYLHIERRWEEACEAVAAFGFNVTCMTSSKEL